MKVKSAVHRRTSRWLRPALVLLAVVALAGFVAFKASPWPSVWLIHWAFQRGGEQASDALVRHVPAGVVSTLNRQYDPADPHAYLDLYRPAALADGASLPAIVWIHGGGFVAGSKTEVANYARVLAARGYVVVAVEYALAPGATYPTPLRQVNRALAYLLEHARTLHIDARRFVLAGDSAGAQIAAQVANLVASPDYAREMGIVPALTRARLRGAVLFCGLYDLGLVDRAHPSWFLPTVLWSYAGRKDYWNVPRFDRFSVIDYVTADFPPAFITVGNDDPLQAHSYRMADALERRGVAVDRLFYAKDHVPPLPHEYQFDLDGRDGQQVLRRLDAFLGRVLKPQS
jgi:acetyl esterase